MKFEEAFKLGCYESNPIPREEMYIDENGDFRVIDDEWLEKRMKLCLEKADEILRIDNEIILSTDISRIGVALFNAGYGFKKR